MARTQTLAWEHRDISNASVRIPGAAAGSGGAELEPMGMDAGLLHLITPPPTSPYRPPLKDARSYPGFADLAGGQCMVDGVDTPCEIANSMRQSGAGVNAPMHTMTRVYNPARERFEWRLFQAFADGYQGFVPVGGISSGTGGIKLRNGDEAWGYLGGGRDGFFDHAYYPQNPTHLTESQTAQVITDVANILKNPTCAEFMARLIGRLGKNTGFEPYDINPFVILEAVRAQEKGGLFLDPNYPAGGYALGSLERGTGMIAFIHIDTGPFSSWVNGDTGLHEITHIGRKVGYMYSHIQMAQASYDVARAMGLGRDIGTRLADIPAGLSKEEEKKRDKAASEYFESRLFDACRGKR